MSYEFCSKFYTLFGVAKILSMMFGHRLTACARTDDGDDGLVSVAVL